jgi:hypothetical protein
MNLQRRADILSVRETVRKDEKQMAVDVDAELAKRKKERDNKMRAIRDAGKPEMVSVQPAKPEYRKHLKHAVTGVGFGAEGGAEWPDDQFTKRRVRDGSVTVEQQKAESQAQPEAQQRGAPAEQK